MGLFDWDYPDCHITIDFYEIEKGRKWTKLSKLQVKLLIYYMGMIKEREGQHELSLPSGLILIDIRAILIGRSKVAE